MATSVQKVMTPKLISISRAANLAEAESLMVEKRIRHLPVVDSESHVVGVLSRNDLKSISDLRSLRVEQVMSTPVRSVLQDTPLRSAIFHMLEEKVSCLLVADENEKAIGIVTTDDLLWYLARMLGDDKDENRQPLLTASETQTIGEVANKLSIMGI